MAQPLTSQELALLRVLHVEIDEHKRTRKVVMVDLLMNCPPEIERADEHASFASRPRDTFHRGAHLPYSSGGGRAGEGLYEFFAAPLGSSGGAGSPHAWNFLSATREFSEGPLRLFATAGYGSFLIGGGVVYYTNPGGTGLVLSGAVRVAGFHAAAVFDLRLSEKASIVVGGSYGNYFLQYQGPLPIASFQMRR